MTRATYASSSTVHFPLRSCLLLLELELELLELLELGEDLELDCNCRLEGTRNVVLVDDFILEDGGLGTTVRGVG